MDDAQHERPGMIPERESTTGSPPAKIRPAAEPATARGHDDGAEEETRRIEPPPPTRAEAPTERQPPEERPLDKADLEQPAAYVSLGFTVGDGFKFGCGFVLALAIASVALLVLLSALFLLASLMGVPVPIRQ